MLFRLLWQDKAEKIIVLPEILMNAGVEAGKSMAEEVSAGGSFWLFSPALPFLFLEELAGRMRLKKVASPQKLLGLLEKAVKDLGMALPETAYRLVEPEDVELEGVKFEDVELEGANPEDVNPEGVASGGGCACGVYGQETARVSVACEERLAAVSVIDDDLARRVHGRQIADAEVLRLSRESGYGEREVWRFLQREVLLGRAVWLSAVAPGGWGMVCRRCGCRRVEEWPAYYGRAFSCGECSALGAISSLDVLWRETERKAALWPVGGSVGGSAGSPAGGAVLRMPFALSQAQQRVSAHLEGSGKERILVWAACGAGKTEVCFSRIAQALEQGKRVLFAAPRRDVVHDLLPRLTEAFPYTETDVLSGASEERFVGGQLVMATTHQVMRFYHAFDLIVLDELDAFPFTDGEFLRRAMDQALRPGGKMIFLTATPDPRIMRAVRRGRCGLVQLPARHHRKPLPVPVWKKCALPSWEGVTREEEGGEGFPETPEEASYSELRGGLAGRARERETGAKGRANTVLKEVLGHLSAKGTTLLFVPCVAHVAFWVNRLKALLPGKSISGSWSSDPERVPKIRDLKEGEYALFVTTSILERGITLDGAQVAVLWADHPLFDERMLVQMAGRAGRKRERPEGEVVFLAAGCSRAMMGAERWLLDQNALARKLGLLDSLEEVRKV